MPYTQWQVNDEDDEDNPDVLTAVGRTIPLLPPGMYVPSQTPSGIIWFKADMKEEEIIRFPDSMSNQVVAELEKFWTLEKLFKRHRLPFKRGILLYGGSGTGKTCTLLMVAQDVVERGGYVIRYKNPNEFLQAYSQLREIQPRSPLVVLMEDIDETMDQNKRDIGGLLELLDGVLDLNYVAFLATTNYPERLEERIRSRPSRFDRRIEIPYPSEQTRRLYLESLSKGTKSELLEKMVKDSKGMSLAHIKEFFVSTQLFGVSYTQALADLKTMIQERPRSFDFLSESTQTGQYV